MLNIHTVGAGGGSLAGFDRGGALKVGPESAGANPGPICYGQGEQATVTDANLLLGRLDPGGLLGGEMHLDEDRTRKIFERAKGRLHTIEQFAEGIIRLVNAHMEKALRTISVEYGYDPREFALLSFGGAGPLHACALAQSLSIPQVLVPRMPGALSAYGILVSDGVRDYSRTVMLQPGDEAIGHHFADLERQSAGQIAGQEARAATFRFADLRYAGQGYEITVDWADDYVERFHREHERRYGYADRARSVDIVNLRVRSVLATEAIRATEHPEQSGNGSGALIGEKQMYTEGRWLSGRLYARDQLRAGDTFEGPAVVVEYSATTFVPPHCRVAVDKFLNLVIHVGTN